MDRCQYRLKFGKLRSRHGTLQYTGELRIPKGQLLQYVHMFYQSKFESDLFLLVDNGIIPKERVGNNR
jgi:hypothetical protein